ncbi:MAG TPA: VOC family protein [Polyangia bacterium]|nr:VOC family protein [Polyangia bacterium]
MSAARGFHHLAIQVRDLAATERFYREVLGLAVLERWPALEGPSAGGGGAGGVAGPEVPPKAADGNGERSVWLAVGDGAFLALERVAGGATAAEDAARAARPGLHLVALRIERAAREAWVQRLAAAGVAVEARTAFTLYVRDPEGNRVGLSHWPHAAEAA